MTFLRKMTNNGYKRKVDSMSYAYSNDDLLRISGTTDILQKTATELRGTNTEEKQFKHAEASDV